MPFPVSARRANADLSSERKAVLRAALARSLFPSWMQNPDGASSYSD
jgi:hypothetical protein